MKKKQISALLLTAVMSAGLFAGCRGEQQTAQAEESDVNYLVSEKIEYDYSEIFRKKITTTYSYDDNGLLTAEECSDGSKILYEYNENGKEIKETAYNADGSEEYCYHTEYDENGNMTLQENEMGVSEWTYDNSGRLIKKISGYDGSSTEYEYNENGLLSCEKICDDDGTFYCYYEYGDAEVSEQQKNNNTCRKVVSGDTVSTYRVSENGSEFLDSAVKKDSNDNEIEIIGYYENGNVLSSAKNVFDSDNRQIRMSVLSYSEDGTVDTADDIYITNYDDIIGVEYNDKYTTEAVYDKLGKIVGVKQTTDTGKTLADVLIDKKADYTEYTQMITIEETYMKTFTYRIYKNENKVVIVKYNGKGQADCELTNERIK